MADRLTQLQDCLDELLNQMFYAVRYIQDRAPLAKIPGQPSQATTASTANDSQPSRQSMPDGGPHALSTLPQEEPSSFSAKLREMAQDLVLREQQVEYLINSLPGMGNSQADQERRMRELEVELREAEAERARAESVREELVQGLGKVIMGGRSIG